jgi:hypothetical protein
MLHSFQFGSIGISSNSLYYELVSCTCHDLQFNAACVSFYHEVVTAGAFLCIFSLLNRKFSVYL